MGEIKQIQAATLKEKRQELAYLLDTFRNNDKYPCSHNTILKIGGYEVYRWSGEEVNIYLMTGVEREWLDECAKNLCKVFVEGNGNEWADYKTPQEFIQVFPEGCIAHRTIKRYYES